MPLTNLRNLNRRSYLKNTKRPNPKKMLIRLLVIFIILFVVIYLPIRGVYSSAKTLTVQARNVADAFKRENLDDIRKSLKEMKKTSDGLNTSLSFLFWAGFIPYFGGFYSDAKHFAKAANYELQAAITISDSLDPYKTELGFTGQPTPGQDKVAQF